MVRGNRRDTFSFIQKSLSHLLFKIWCEGWEECGIFSERSYFSNLWRWIRYKFYEIFLLLKDASGENVESYYRQARSLVESHEQVIEDENCVVMGVKSAKKLFKHGTEQVDFSMKIRNLKDEAKDEDDESGIDDWKY